MQGWPQWEHIYRKKRQHKLVATVTEMLAKIDCSWKRNQVNVKDESKLEIDDSNDPKEEDDRDEDEKTKKMEIEIKFETNEKNKIEEGGSDEKEKKKEKKKEDEFDFNKLRDHQETPLLIAASNGIIEVVEKIIEANPQAIDYVTEKQRNILHVAISHRQEKIFNWLRKNRFIMARLVNRIDASGFTALHQVGITKYNRYRSHGPAIQLQQELQWYERVKKEIPALYLMHYSKNKGKARDFFNESHMESLSEGKEWFKKTSESCSAVAVLVATVVFAAAYTVPGGLNSQTGTPVLLSQPIYMIFTIMDILALATSLSSVAFFLSILTSSFEMEDFLLSLPLKLTIGFQLLFFSVACTMMAFALTIVLTMKSAHLTWTIYFIYVSTFFPVTLFIIIQMPLYVKLLKNIWSYSSTLFPTGFVPSSSVLHSTHHFKRKFA